MAYAGPLFSSPVTLTKLAWLTWSLSHHYRSTPTSAVVGKVNDGVRNTPLELDLAEPWLSVG